VRFDPSIVTVKQSSIVSIVIVSIPLQLALDCTENAIKNSTVELPLPTDGIMDLLNLCLTSTYFQYNGKHYKQLHGTAMGSMIFFKSNSVTSETKKFLTLRVYGRFAYESFGQRPVR